MDLKPYISELATGLIAIVIGWVAKSKNQKRQEEAGILDKVQGIYDKMIEDTNQRMDELKIDIENLKKKQTLIDAEWRKKVQQVEKKWQTKYSRLQAKYNSLLKEFEEYKSKHE
ncbi:MAG TPA: hypothetical protein DHV22_08090 [Xanthomarina gelatinilytica]|uniref:Uncharacterized protein n=1 Tax=Xanthomarina gelatinilytica TaxID=1137281 RepID=A0A3D6BRF1_9FLAO|nr:hypothetical protein [Xanthomarina gelatinilytica]